MEAPKKCAKIEREPKGGPDVVFLAKRSDLPLIRMAGDLLSVRGYTARLVAIDDEVAFDSMEESGKLRYIEPSRPFIRVREPITPQQLAKDALDAINA